jgi:hypothetical protein
MYKVGWRAEATFFVKYRIEIILVCHNLMVSQSLGGYEIAETILIIIAANIIPAAFLIKIYY